MIDFITQMTTDYLQKGSFFVFLVVFWAGFLTSLTPCLYPVIPLTVGYFSAQSADSRFKTFIMVLLYIFGISVVYTILGLIAAITGTFFGSISNHPYMYFAIANICIILAIWMMGDFNIPLPSFMKSIHINPKRKGYIGSFVVGCSSGLVLGACAAPVMAVILTYVASKQNILFGGSVLFVFALGKSILLLGIGMFAGLIKLLPKAGMWMSFVKKILALFLIGMGEWYLIKMGMNLF
ncbi:sulfite exporter TauE/SafE family protein [bacterium]|nr:sulfite exporter TauE/SafE family protein [bacterium]